MSSVRTAVKRLQAAIEKGESKETLQSLFVSAQSMLAKASSKGRLHSNNVARKVSRLSKLVKNAATAEPKAVAKKKTTKKKKAAAKKKKTAAKKKKK